MPAIAGVEEESNLVDSWEKTGCFLGPTRARGMVSQGAYRRRGVYFKGAEVEQSQTEAEHERLQQ